MFLLCCAVLCAVLVAAAPTPRTPAQWYTVEWQAPEFTAMSGDFVIPEVSSGAKGTNYFVWPGLQSDSGVLQAELDGHSGSQSLGNKFYGTTSQSLGPRAAVSPGQTVHFSFVRTSSGTWTCTLSGADMTLQTFTTPGNTMNRAILAINLTGVLHDFEVVYRNVVITAVASQATEWCTDSWSRGYGHGGYSVQNAVADGTTCRIGQVIMPGTT